MTTDLSVSPFFFVKDDGAWLTRQTKPFLGAIDRINEIIVRHIFNRWGIYAQRKQVLLALCCAAYGLGFTKGRMQVVGCKTAYLMDINTLIVLFHEVISQILTPAALVADKEH